jgi:hypothetical protein
MQIGKPLPVDGDMVAAHAHAAAAFCVGLLIFVDDWLSTHEDPVRDSED